MAKTQPLPHLLMRKQVEPPVVEALEFTGDLAPVAAWVNGHTTHPQGKPDLSFQAEGTLLVVLTPQHGHQWARVGDLLIRDGAGVYAVLKMEEREKHYQLK